MKEVVDSPPQWQNEPKGLEGGVGEPKGLEGGVGAWCG